MTTKPGSARIAIGLAGATALAAAAIRNHRYAREIERRHPPVGKFVEIKGGQRLHYVEAGSGPPVVLIHGASNLLQDMTTSLMPVLARKHRVIAFDRPGHGWSTRRPYRAWDVLGLTERNICRNDRLLMLRGRRKSEGSA